MENKHFLATLSREQQVTELYLRRVELSNWLAKNWAKLTDTGKLKAKIDLEEMKGEQERTERELDKSKDKSKQTALHGSLTDLQRHGAYASPATVTLIDVSKSIHHEIKGLRHDIRSQSHGAHEFGKAHY